MLFNTLTFLVFATGFFLVWGKLRTHRIPTLRYAFLVAASLLFYGWWSWRYLALILLSGLVDYFAALGMVRTPERRKTFLIASVCANIGILTAFKYLGFFAANASWLAAHLGLDVQFGHWDVALPVGISFYTFQSMTYTIDVYRGKLVPTRNVLLFFAYLSLFPQLVAGPIVRAAHLIPQLAERRSATYEQLSSGSRLILYGFAKKMLIADNLAPIVDNLFRSTGPNDPMTTMASAWIVMMMFGLQIYADFSGYSDIARGLGKWMGLDFEVNFNRPYRASSVREFWTRWHITLSSWFRDYVYIPLGGNRGSVWRGLTNAGATMVLSGLWHGASWNFIIWGALHALYLAVERLTKWPTRLRKIPGGTILCVLLVYILTHIAWVFFRAPDLATALHLVQTMFDFGNLRWVEIQPWGYNWRDLWWVLLVAGLAHQWWPSNLRLMPKNRDAADKLFFYFGAPVLITLIVFLRGPTGTFIYFQF